MAEPKAHQLYKQVDGSSVQYHESPPFSSATNGWEVISSDANALIIAFRSYIDLAGWTRQDLTTFTQGVDIQKQSLPLAALTNTQSDRVHEYDFLTTRILTDAELTYTGGFSLPGFASSTCDLMEVVYGERMAYASNTQIEPVHQYIQVGGETFGSGNPTAMDKLHWTRLYVIHYPFDSDGIILQPANLVVQAMTVKEKDLVWMERLRRSYVLQGEL